MYKNLTLQEKYTLFLMDSRENGGLECVEVETRSGKYKAFKRPNMDKFVFLGKGGAIRTANKNSSTGSFDVSAGYKVLFNLWENKNHKGT